MYSSKYYNDCVLWCPSCLSDVPIGEFLFSPEIGPYKLFPWKYCSEEFPIHHNEIKIVRVNTQKLKSRNAESSRTHICLSAQSSQIMANTSQLFMLRVLSITDSICFDALYSLAFFCLYTNPYWLGYAVSPSWCYWVSYTYVDIPVVMYSC